MTLPSGPQIQGRVRNEAGEPVPDVLVCVDTAFTTGRICRPSGFDGGYAVTTRPSTYIINVIPPRGSGYIAEYLDRKRNWVEADEVRLGTGDVQVDLVLRRGVIVKGTIKDKRGVPAVSATINFGDPREVEHAGATDGNGAFEVVVVPGQVPRRRVPAALPGEPRGPRDGDRRQRRGGDRHRARRRDSLASARSTLEVRRPRGPAALH